MAELHSDAVGQLVEWMGQESDEVLEEMEARAEQESFRRSGLRLVVHWLFALDYRVHNQFWNLVLQMDIPPYWIARTLPSDGTITLTERDRDLLDDARTYFERGDLTERAIFKHGDALEIAENCTDSYDLVVLDHDTADYVSGYQSARQLVNPGGAILIDNVAIYEEVLTPNELLATLNGEAPPNERTRIVAEFLEHLQDDPIFETYVLPVGEGLAISYRVQ